MKLKNTAKKIVAITLICGTMIGATGCASLSNWINKVKGELIGQQFNISMYDDSGSKTLDVSGSKITVGLLENSSNYNAEDLGFKSEVLDITINGKQMIQVGNTCIFAEKGLDMITDFETPTSIEANSGGGFVPIDRLVNNFKNKIGKEKVVMISSQDGLPIGVFQGNKVYVEVPSDLPKMTRLNIDGKSLYIHRANYTIVDADLIK